MYYPYFRGKQYELIAIRECAEVLATAGFIPIIEPVRQSVSGLVRCLDELSADGAKTILIVNPKHGDHATNSDAIHEILLDDLSDNADVGVGILLGENEGVDEIISLFDRYREREISLIHNGYSNGRELRQALGGREVTRNIFVEQSSGKLYRRHFEGPERVLIRDGFERRTNRQHPDVEFYSDLHATYEQEGVDGFGDFLIVGDDYSESGGPAYAVAIHLTFIDNDRDGGMYVHHFKSIRQDTPKDPAGKFAEALEKLVREVRKPRSPILETTAVQEFLTLHEKGHFPGLGYVKKLSMIHHLETLAEYFEQRG